MEVMAHASRFVRSVGAAAVMLVILITAGCAGSWLREPPPERVLDEILPASVQVVLEQQEGRTFRSASGVVVAGRSATSGPNCFILTSGHTFLGGGRTKEIRVLFRRHEGSGTRASATLLAVSNTDQLDLALLGTRSAFCPVARLGRGALLGESVWLVAFPWGRELTVSRGVISQVRRSEPAPGAGRLMVDATVSYGASGGGVFRARGGELIGLVEGYATARVAFQGAASPAHVDVPVAGQTFLTPATDLQEFLRENLPGRSADETVISR